MTVRVERVAEKLTDYLIAQNAVSKEEYGIYKYGFQIGMEMLICVITCFIMALHMGIVVQFIVFFTVFYMLRSLVGGLHLDGFIACYVCSCLVFLGVLLLVKYAPLERYASMMVSVLEILLILLSEPVENRNRPVDHKEKITFAVKIRKLSTVIIIGVLFFTIMNAREYLNTVTYTLGVILTSMLFGKIKNVIDENKGFE